MLPWVQPLQIMKLMQTYFLVVVFVFLPLIAMPQEYCRLLQKFNKKEKFNKKL